MKKQEIDQFETIQGQLQAFHTEMGALVKKNPNDPLNAFKLQLVNAVLRRANAFLGKARLPFAEFEAFEDSTLPSTSDVLVIVAQYLSAFEKFRSENIHLDFDSWYWKGPDNIRTAPPKKLRA
jgi:hypothetical protein